MIAVFATAAGIVALIGTTLAMDRRRNGKQPLGALATRVHGTWSIRRHLVDETGTITASSAPTVLSVTSATASTSFETFRAQVGVPRYPPDVDCVRFPTAASDDSVFAAHRNRIAKAEQPLIVFTSIEQLAQFYMELFERTRRWRNEQDQDELLEADLRSILDGSYAALGERVKAQLGRGLPRAKLRRA